MMTYIVVIPGACVCEVYPPPVPCLRYIAFIMGPCLHLLTFLAAQYAQLIWDHLWHIFSGRGTIPMMCWSVESSMEEGPGPWSADIIHGAGGDVQLLQEIYGPPLPPFWQHPRVVCPPSGDSNDRWLGSAVPIHIHHLCLWWRIVDPWPVECV